MKSSDLNQLLTGFDNGDKLKALIKEEVDNYATLMQKRGSTIPILFKEDEAILIDKKTLNYLFKAVLEKKLTSVDLAYICDCLTMGETVDYANEEVEDMVFSIADPEINTGYQSPDDIAYFFKQTQEDWA